MPTFKKRVAGPGLYTTPSGPAEVTPARIRHWDETLKGIIASGYSPPLSWGHAKGATPHTPEDQAYWSARFNAGKVTGSEIDAEGHLVLTAEAPGLALEGGALVGSASLPDGTSVPTSIDKVSIGVRDWTDGSGKTWADAPIHLALVPLPVWEPEGGQPGFEDAGQSFGTDTFLGTEAAPVGKETAAEDDKPPVLNKYVEEAKVALVGLGLTLPADTDGSNILERICVACGAMKAAKAKGDDINTPVTEDTQGGSYMSTETARDPHVQALAARLEAAEKKSKAQAAFANSELRKTRVTDIATLERRGLARASAVELRAMVSATNFALNEEGVPEPNQADFIIEALKKSLPTEEAVKTMLFSTRTGNDVVEAEAPEDAQTGDRKHKRVLEEYLKTVQRGSPPLAKAV